MKLTRGIVKLMVGLCLSLLVVILTITIGSTDIIQQMAIKKTIVILGETFEQAEIRRLDGLFASDALVGHHGRWIGYKEAFETFQRNVAEVGLIGSLYVGDFEELSGKYARVSHVAWFRINDDSYEASGTVELERIGLWGWKIKKISSDTWAFGRVFFDKQ